MKRLISSFRIAMCGILSCLKTERNMRIHFCAAFYVLIFMQFYQLSKVQTTLIILTIGSVISAEAMNTAIEAAVDLCTKEIDPIAKFAKDTAAGAVFVTAAAAAAVGIVTFWDTEAFAEIFHWFGEHIAALILLILSAAVWTAFIFMPCGRNNINKNKGSKI